MKKKFSKKFSLSAVIFIMIFTVYSIYIVTDMQIKINKEQIIQEELKKSIQEKTIELRRLEDMLDNFPDDEYIAQEARAKLSYAARDEIVYKDIGGR